MCRFIPSKRLPSPGNAILAGAVFWRRSSCYGGRRPSGCCLLHGMQHRRRRRDRGSTSSKPPVIPDPGGRPDYIAAARRAAQVAAAASPRARAATAAKGPSLPGNLTQRLRKLIVAAAVVVIIVGGVHIALRLSSRTPAPAHPRSRGWSQRIRRPRRPRRRRLLPPRRRVNAGAQGDPASGSRCESCARQGAAGERTAGAGAVLFGAGNRHQAAAAITER